MKTRNIITTSKITPPNWLCKALTICALLLHANSLLADNHFHTSGVRVSNTDGSTNSPVNVNIRGVNTLRGDSQPLYIVDGVVLNPRISPYLGAFKEYGQSAYTSSLENLFFLSKDDIESVEIIKDASKTALYGLNGANGVIIITTKRGNIGEDCNIDLHTNTGLSSSYIQSDYFTPAISHRHYIGISGGSQTLRYYVSGNFKDIRGVAPHESQEVGGLTAGFDSKSNSVVEFGLNTRINLGNLTNTSGTAYIGRTSMMSSIRNVYRNDISGYASGWEKDYDDKSKDRRANASFYLQLNLAPWLKWRSDVGCDFRNNVRNIWYGNGTEFGLKYNGAAGQVSSNNFRYNARTSIEAERHFDGIHHIKLVLSAEANGQWNKLNSLAGTDFFSHELRAEGLNISASKPKLYKLNDNVASVGTVASLSYSLNEIFGLSGILRADFIDEFLNSQPIIFPAGNAYVDLHKLLLKGNQTLSTLNISGGYGQSGHIDLLPWEFYTILRPSYKIDSGSQPYYKALNRLHSSEWNAGVTLGLLNDRVRLYVGYFDKRTDDILSLYCNGEKNDFLWDSTDNHEVISESSTLLNRGVEIDFTAFVFRTKNLGWSIYASATYNTGKMGEVCKNDLLGGDVGEYVFPNRFISGESIGALYGYDTSTQEMGVIGSPIPTFYGNVGTSVNINGVTLDIIAEGAFGHHILNMNRLVSNQLSPYTPTSKFVEKGDFVRLAEVKIGYDIPIDKVEWVKNINVYLSGQNLFTLTGYSGWNPDVNSFGSSARFSGIDFGSFPAVRSFIFGVKANF